MLSVTSELFHLCYQYLHLCYQYLVNYFTCVIGGGWVRQRCHVSYATGASNWYSLTVGQGLLSLQQVRVEGEMFYCLPPFRRKARGHGIWLSVVRGAWFRVCSRYLVSAIPPTVLIRYLWNFTGVLIISWRFTSTFLQNPKIIIFSRFSDF